MMEKKVSAPLDVLAVMQGAADMAYCHGVKDAAADIAEARAAVAELVEASRSHMLAAHRVQAEKVGSYEREKAENALFNGEYYRLRAALAKFDGAA